MLTLLFVLPMFFQFRANYHDPILAYNGMLQHLFSLLLISLILLLHYLQNEKKFFLALSIVLYFFSLMIYEIAIPMVAIHLFIIYNHYGYSKKTVKTALPFLFITLLNCVYLFYLKSFVINQATQYSGLMININPIKMIKTYILQLFSTLPLSYLLFFRKGPSLLEMIEHFSSIHFLGISLLFIIIVHSLAPRLNSTFSRYDQRLTVIGLLLFLLPALPMAVSFKYQQELRFGIGYLPVYLQYFGLLLIMVNVFCLFAQRASASSNAPGRGYPLAFAIVYLIVVMTSLSNIASIKQSNKSSYPVKILRLALANNILGDEDEDIVLLLKDKYFINMRYYQYLFYEYIGRYISVSTVDEYLDEIRTGGVSGSLNLQNKKVYILKSPPADLEDIYLSIGRIYSIDFDSSEDGNILISHCKYFTSNKHLYQRVSYESRSSKTVKTMNTILKTRGHSYSLYSVSFKDKHAIFDSLRFY